MDNRELRVLLDRIQAGDRDGFEALYQGMAPPLYTVLVRMVQDRHQAEDLLQELFLKLYRAPPGPEVRNPRAYLFQSARNLALDALRRRPCDAGLDALEEALGHQPDLDLRLELEDALAALTLEERQILVLRLNGGLKFREAAQVLGQPLGTVLWRYQKAIGRLRAQLLGGIP